MTLFPWKVQWFTPCSIELWSGWLQVALELLPAQWSSRRSGTCWRPRSCRWPPCCSLLQAAGCSQLKEKVNHYWAGHSTKTWRKKKQLSKWETRWAQEKSPDKIVVLLTVPVYLGSARVPETEIPSVLQAFRTRGCSPCVPPGYQETCTFRIPTLSPTLSAFSFNPYFNLNM